MMTKLFRNLAIATTLVFLAACAAGGANPSVGAWDISMDTPVGSLSAVLSIGADGTGTMSSDELGDVAIDGITLDGNTIAFSVDVDAQGQSLTLDFAGSVEGDEINGEFGSDFGAFGVTGTRAQ